MIAVVADSGDPASAALHRACGFTDAGRLRNVGRKHGRLIDTLLLQCDLARV
jgi:phosphinothricin acetyltransferase